MPHSSILPKFSLPCLTLLSSLLLLAGCTPSAGESGDPPGDAAAGNDSDRIPKDPAGDAAGNDSGETPPPAKAANTTIRVASVQLIQDCPDTEVEPAPAGDEPPPAASQPSPGAMAPEMRRKRSPGGSGGFHQPCDQSTIQLALQTDSAGPVQIEVKAVRLMDAGASLTTLTSRKPKIWQNNSYERWDQQLAPGAEIKVSYKIALPDDWAAIERKIGGTSYGHMFTLEIDVAVDGEIQTVTSPAFPREQPNVIVT